MGRRRFGSIRKLPSGRYQARYPLADGGLHPAPQTFATKTDADRFLAQVETDMGRGQWSDPRLGSVMVADWSRHYLDTCVHLAPATVQSYESLRRSVIVPAFGSRALSSVARGEVRAWVAELTARGLSASRVRQAYVLLSAMMTAAVEDGVIMKSPCMGVKLPRLPRRELTYLTPPQVAQLVTEMPEPYRLLVDVLAYGGLRFGEAVALRRHRCDLLNGRLIVAESASEVEGRLIFGDTKSHRQRSVTLPRTVVSALRAHLAEHVPADRNSLVFTAPAGGPLRYGNFLHRAWRPAVKRLGQEGITPHVLRHTSATLLIAAGASVKDVQAHLGHADGAVTLNIYSAVLDGRADDLAAKLDVLHEQGQRAAIKDASGTQVAREGDEGDDDPPAVLAKTG